MTGKGLWAELEFMEGAECKKMLKGELTKALNRMNRLEGIKYPIGSFIKNPLPKLKNLQESPKVKLARSQPTDLLVPASRF